jgi:hypothetical protein
MVDNRPRPPNWLAPVGALALLCAGSIASASVSFHHWGRPKQILVFPWLAHVPIELLAAFLAVAVVGCAAAALVAWWLAPGLTRGWRGCVLTSILVGLALVGVWEGLYTIAPEDEPIQVDLLPLLAFSSGASALVSRSAQTRRGEQVAAALLVLVPLVSLEVLGDCIRYGFQVGLEIVLIIGGPGILLGLLLAVIPPQRRSA